MKILGVHDGHTATAALLSDGGIEAVISEERINRIKEWQGLPKESIKRILKITKTDPKEIDLVVFASRVQQIDREQYSEDKFSFNMAAFNSLKKISPRKFMSGDWWVEPAIKIGSRLRKKAEIFSFFENLGIEREKIIFADHHTCHAYSTLSNPWEINNDALVITLDGAGDGYCCTVNLLDNGRIKPIEKTSLYNSLGFLYSKATEFLNMKPWSHEYKVMGLAAYAKEENYKYVYKKLAKEYIRINPNNPLRLENISGCVFNDYMKKLERDFRNTRFDNFAGGLQRFTEEIILQFIKNCVKKTKKSTVLCSGGVFMNIKANMRIMYETDIKKLFIFPSCGDESNSIGACNYGYALLCRKRGIKLRYKKMKDIYFGDEFSNEDIKKTLDDYKDKIKFSFIKDIGKHVAEELSKDKIIARFAGRMEFGARALGNRSILAHPGNKDTIRQINNAIKMRDFWMPFAGTIIEEDQNKYLINPKKMASPHMLMGFKTQEKTRSEIISALHPYDLTCRPQILEKSYNPEYYKLIKEFKSLTGIGCLLNTSFNIHGEPLVSSPIDAINTLLKSDLKYLAIGNYYVEKK